MIWSYVCAGGATLGFVLTMAVARAGGGAETQQIVGVLFLLLAFLPSVVGVGLGVGAIDRRHRNPPVLWAATIWNGVVLGIFLLLCIVGLMK